MCNFLVNFTFCGVLNRIVNNCVYDGLVLYCIVLYRLFIVSFLNSENTLVMINIKQLFSGNQVLIKLLNCLVFCAVFIDSESEFQILGPWKLNDLIPFLVFLAFGF